MATNYGLVDLLKVDGSITDDEAMKYISLAKLFEEDFRANLKLTSLDLDDKYKTNDPALWLELLNLSSVSRFIDNYIYEETDKEAKKLLTEGSDARALKIVQEMDKKKMKEDNSNIYVMCLPSKEDVV